MSQGKLEPPPAPVRDAGGSWETIQSAGPDRPRWRFAGRDPMALALLVIVTAASLLLVVPPLIFLLQASVTEWVNLEWAGWTIDHFRGILDSNVTWQLVSNTITYGAGSSVLGLAMGAYFAWICGRTDGNFKKTIYAALFISFAIPNIISTIGWILLLGPRTGVLNELARGVGLQDGLLDIFTMYGMILSESVGYVPVAFLLLLVPLSSMDPSLEEAGQMAGGSTWQVVRRVTIPLAWPSVLAALILSFIRAVEGFETPAILGIPSGVRVFTTEIYMELTRGFLPAYGSASAYAVLLMGVVALLLWFYTRATGQVNRFSTITGKGFKPKQMELGRLRRPLAAVTLFLLLLQFLPLLAMVWASILPYYQAPSPQALETLTLTHYATVFANPLLSRAVRNTLIVAAGAAVGVTTLTFLAAWLMVRSKLPGVRGLDFLVSLPIVIPGIVIGVAVLRTYIGLPLPIYGTLLILVLGYWLKYIPYSMRYSHAGLLQIHPELEESAEVCGAPVLTRFRRIIIPLALPALLAGMLYVFLIAGREFTMALLLYSPGTEVISVAIFDLYENGQFSELSAYAVVVSTGFVAIATLLFTLVRRKGLNV